MTACTCGSRTFDIDAVYAAKDRIIIDEDGEGFGIADTNYMDGEWQDMGTVRCVQCGKETQYSEWSKEEHVETDATRSEVLNNFLFVQPDTADAVRAVPGVTKVEETSDPLKGLLELTVWGGDEHAIAQAIYQNKTIGILTTGNTSIVIHDAVSSCDFKIRFNRERENQQNYDADGSGGW